MKVCTTELRLNWKRLGKQIHHPLIPLAKENHETGIFSYLRLAIRIASAHASIAPVSLEDDLVSVALEALVEAWSDNADVNDLTHYITKKVHNACTEFLRREHPTINSTRNAQNNPEVRVEKIGKRDFSLEDHDLDLLELKELIFSVAENPLERDILTLRMLGHTDQEIANSRGIDRREITHIRASLELRFKSLERKLELEET